MKDPENPKQWIVDDPAASVVQRIFALCLDGYGPSQIARIFQQEQVLLPSAYKMAQGRKTISKTENKYGWHSDTVSNILARREYTGCTVNFKTYRTSYKDNRSRKRNPEQQLIFENTQEAIIDQATWDRVQVLRENKRRPTKIGKTSIFSGLLYCGDCGAKMYFATANHFSPNQEHFVCSASRKIVDPCSTHYIREQVLQSLVLEHLRQTLSFASEYKTEFIRLIGEKSASEQKHTLSKKKKALSKAQVRTQELDKLFQRVYEDNVIGKLSDAQFEKLSRSYEDEQSALSEQINTLTQDLQNEERQAVNLGEFFKLVQKYTEIQELNATILNELIEKILIYFPEKTDGKRTQRIEIYYSFVGMLPEIKENGVA